MHRNLYDTQLLFTFIKICTQQIKLRDNYIQNKITYSIDLKCFQTLSTNNCTYFKQQNRRNKLNSLPSSSSDETVAMLNRKFKIPMHLSRIENIFE